MQAHHKRSGQLYCSLAQIIKVSEATRVMVESAYEHNPGKFPVGVHFDLDQGTVTSIAHIIFIFICISEIFNHLCVTEGLRINPPPPKKIQLTVVVWLETEPHTEEVLKDGVQRNS